MIVDPDFFDHWKTRLLIEMSGDDTSPLWVMRLWAHAQLRRTGVFENLPAAAVKAIAKASNHDSEDVSHWLEASGFIRRSGNSVSLHEWEEYNRGMIASWSNGQRGGRKRTHGLPTGNLQATHREPTLPLLSSPISSSPTGGSGDVNNYSDPPAVNPVPPGDPIRDMLRAHPQFVEAWRRWEMHLEEVGKPMTKTQRGPVLMDCGRYGPARGIEVIEFSIKVGAKNLLWDKAPQGKAGRALAASRAQQSANPEGWAEWRNENYPNADRSVPYSQISLDIQKEFETRNQHPK